MIHRGRLHRHDIYKNRVVPTPQRCLAPKSFMKGHPGVIELIEGADWIGVPAIVLGELQIGFFLGSKIEKNEAILREFLDHQVVETLPTDAHTARIYAEMLLDLRRAGTPLPSNDIWIAACATQHGATVVTLDAHFHKINRAAAVVLDTSF